MSEVSNPDEVSAAACPFRRLPPKPEPMPPNPSLRMRLERGLKSSLDLVQDAAFHTGGVGRHVVPQLPSGKRRFLFTVREPEMIRAVLVGRQPAYPKSRLMQNMLEDLLGSSVFIANGETWRWRRAIVDQALDQARVRDVMRLMRDAADALVGRLEAQVGDTRPAAVRMDVEITRFAADVIFRTIFSEPIGEAEAERIIADFEVYQGVAYAHGMLRLARTPVNLLPSAWRRRRAARAIRKALAAPLARRLEAQAEGRPTPDGDILASLIACADPKTGRRLSAQDLLDEVCMFFLAGHETSASALGWALYLLAMEPAIQDAARAEALNVLGERPAEFGDIKALELIRNIFREAMRLYPPVAQLARDALEPDQMGERAIAPGEVVFCTPWVMHRQGRFWRDPDAFDPGRFDTEAGREAVRQAYFPFSMGPRVCPGAAFALQEASLVLAMLLRRFVFEPIAERPPTPIGRLTLRSRTGVWLNVRRRNAGE